MPKPIIVAATRSPIGRAHKGSLVAMRPDDLAAAVVRSAVDQVPQLPADEIVDLLLGCAQPAGESGFNLARNVAVLAGLPGAAGATVNRYCASSMQTIRMAAHAVAAGEGEAFVAAGVETVSRFHHGTADVGPYNPRFAVAERRTALRQEGGQPPWTPSSGLPDVYIAMGQTAENVREVEGITRAEMDEYAALSQQRACSARDAGRFDAEITPIELPDGTSVQRDDGPRDGTTVEALAGLRPVFRQDGEVTAGNSCPLNDGAAAVVVMSDRRAQELGIAPLARVVATAVSAINPEIMGLGPVEASRRALASAGMTIDDIGAIEINEAFAAQVIPSARQLNVPWDKLNVHGGAIALGHPFGMSGARIVTTLMNVLRTRQQHLGLAAMCVGGGQGMAVIIERLR